MFARLKQRLGALSSGQRREESHVDAQLAYSELVDEQHDDRFAQQAIRMAAIGFAVFVIWATLTPIHEITPGQGAILPQGFVQQAQHVDGGIVHEVVVREGETVEAGAPLVVLDDTQVRAELAKAQAREVTLRLSIERARAFVDEREAEIQNTAGLRGIVESQRELALSADGYRRAQLAVLKSDIDMKMAEFAALRIRLEKAGEELAIVKRQLADFDAASKSGAISRRERDAVEREMIRMEIEIASLNGQYASLKAGITQSRARETEMISRFRQESFDEIGELESQYAETLETVAQLSARLESLVVRAPVAGLVHNLAVRNSGAVIRPGDIVAEIVPTTGDIFAEVEIPASDVGYLRQGMDADVKVLTFDPARFGTIAAKVEHISPTHFERQDGTTVFQVRLRLARIFVGPESAGRRVRPGMSVVADIKSGSRSVMSYLLKPLRAISDRAFTET